MEQMKHTDTIKERLESFRNVADRPFQFDEEAIVTAYQNANESPSLPVKILSIFGGLLANLAFVGFLFIAGLYKSDVGLLLSGGIFIVGAIGSSRSFDRTITDTISISAFITGCALFLLGCEKINASENIISMIFILIGLGTLSIVRNYVLAFISVLIINGSMLTLIVSNKDYAFIHMYISALALGTTYFFMKEATIITTNKAFSKLYNPVRAGLIFSFVSALALLGEKKFFPLSSDFIWLSSIVIILIIIYLIYKLFDILNIKQTKLKTGIYIFTVLGLLPTILAPSISGAFLVLLLCFLVAYQTGFVLGIISFVYFIAQYYYNLDFTLLTKSILLFATGVFFSILYWFTLKKLTANEKV